MESTEHDFTQDEVGEEEKNLAQQLKDLCKDGKEMDGTELRAAVVFYELAKIYENKPNYKELNMTRSAALYNAAIVRDPNNQRYKDELKALCSAVLVEADAANRNADLIYLASTVKTKLQEFRKDFGKNFNQLEIIPYGLKDDDQLIILQRRKVLNVKNLQQEVTKRYTELMRFISDECIEIMGAPPCKYAVVGLGSLARSGITLYSDFEHIIVLDNDVAKMEDRKIIMKYFRWFTTIFNIILINLGETMINCVAIPSINPRYRDWFTDNVTRNGVTFDGMVAHACIRPLGRPATENKPWNTEFIKPVDEMVQYLDSDEQVKQGYHVAEVLSNACFVAGDEAICNEYQEKAYRSIKEHDKENGFSIVYKRMEEILKIFNFIKLLFNTQLGLQNFNIKRAIYRGATLFISYIGRLHSLQASCCFDVIDELEKHGKCSEEAAHQFRFMVAVTCEVRAKLYHLKEQQDDVFMEDSRFEDLTPGLIEIVGKQSLVSLMETMMVVQGLKIPDNDKWQSEMIILGKDVRHRMFALYTLLLHEDLVELMKQVVSPSQADILFPLQAVEVAFKSKEYDLIIKICSNLNQSKLTVNQKFEYKVYELASIVNRSYNKETKSFEGSRSEVEAKVKELEEVAATVEPDSINMNLILKTDYDSLKVAETNEPSISWVYTVKIYSDTLMLLYNGKIPNNSSIHAVWKQLLNLMCHDTSNTTKNEILCVYAEVLMKNEQSTEALRPLFQAKQILQQCKKKTTYMHMHLYYKYTVCYYETSRYYKALICWLEYVRICKKLKEPIPDDYKQGMKNTFQLFIFHRTMKLCESAGTLRDNEEPTEALKILDEAEQLMQPYKLTTTLVQMRIYHSYAFCYHKTGRYYEALICGLEYARIGKKLKLPIHDDIKPRMKNSFQRFIFRHPLRLCESAVTLIDNKKPTKALKLLDEAKQMMQPYKLTTTVVHMNIYYAYAIYCNNTDRYYEALICWLQCARIGKKFMHKIPDAKTKDIKILFHKFLSSNNL